MLAFDWDSFVWVRIASNIAYRELYTALYGGNVCCSVLWARFVRCSSCFSFSSSLFISLSVFITVGLSIRWMHIFLAYMFLMYVCEYTTIHCYACASERLTHTQINKNHSNTRLTDSSCIGEQIDYPKNIVSKSHSEPIWNLWNGCRELSYFH